jgi:sugar phosphate isomerase/epimerase
MKLSFATLGCPDWTLEHIAQQAAALGFDGVELRGAAGNHIGPDESPAELARIRGLFADAGVAICCIMGYTKFTDDDPAARAQNVALTRTYIGVAQAIGCPTLRIFGGHNPQVERQVAIERLVSCLREVAPMAADHGVQLAIETHDDWCIGANLAAAIAGVDHPAVGVCWDIANSHFREPMARTHAAIREHIVHVHFKDAVKSPAGGAHANHSVLPGEGEVDMPGGLALLKSSGYDGWLSFEWEKKWEPELAEPEVAFPHYLRVARDLLDRAGIARG